MSPMSDSRLKEINAHNDAGRHVTNGMVGELIAEVERARPWQAIAETTAKFLWDARAFLKTTEESPAAVERITDDMERLEKLHAALTEARP